VAVGQRRTRSHRKTPGSPPKVQVRVDDDGQVHFRDADGKTARPAMRIRKEPLSPSPRNLDA